VFILACYVAWWVMTQNKDKSPKEQAEIFLAAVIAGPIAGLITSMGAGPTDQATYWKEFYKAVVDVKDAFPGWFPF